MALGAALGAAIGQPDDGTGNGDFDNGAFALLGGAIGVPVGIIAGAAIGANARTDRWEPAPLPERAATPP